MGVSYVVRVGPYIELSNLSIDSKKDIMACLNKSCPENTKPASGKFCPNCGDKLCNAELTQKRKLSSAEIVEDYVWVCPNSSMFYDHDADDGSYYFYSRELMYEVDYFVEVIKIEPDCIKKSLIEFNKDFKDTIARLKEVFGEDHVTVSYGIVTIVC
jgi:hypothetical protein